MSKRLKLAKAEVKKLDRAKCRAEKVINERDNYKRLFLDKRAAYNDVARTIQDICRGSIALPPEEFVMVDGDEKLPDRFKLARYNTKWQESDYRDIPDPIDATSVEYIDTYLLKCMVDVFREELKARVHLRVGNEKHSGYYISLQAFREMRGKLVPVIAKEIAERLYDHLETAD